MSDKVSGAERAAFEAFYDHGDMPIQLPFTGQKGAAWAAWQASRLAALEEAAKVADAEARLYRDNASKCASCGNTAGEIHDGLGAAACEDIAAALRTLAQGGAACGERSET